MNAAGNEHRRKGSKTRQAKSAAATRVPRIRPRTGSATPPAEPEEGGLVASLTYDVGASREAGEAEGIVDDYPRIDGADADVPDGTGDSAARGRRSG